jgi:hypothetical protein
LALLAPALAPHFFGPMPRSFTQRALGSGVIIDNRQGQRFFVALSRSQ